MKLPKFNCKTILLYYSTIFATFLILGGFFMARSIREVISNLLFLPITVFLWIIVVQRIKLKRLNNSRVNELTN